MAHNAYQKGDKFVKIITALMKVGISLVKCIIAQNLRCLVRYGDKYKLSCSTQWQRLCLDNIGYLVNEITLVTHSKK